MTRYQELCAERKLNCELQRLGCPYEHANPLCAVWLEGYWHGARKGIEDAKQAALKAIAA